MMTEFLGALGMHQLMGHKHHQHLLIHLFDFSILNLARA